MSGQKSGGGARKVGRNKEFCKRYRLIGQREKNKVKKLARHFKRVEKKRIKLALRAA